MEEHKEELEEKVHNGVHVNVEIEPHPIAFIAGVLLTWWVMRKLGDKKAS